MHPLIEAHRQQIKMLAARHGFQQVRVFGSMLRGDAEVDSDIDLLVSLPPGRTGLALGGLQIDVEDLVQRPVDVVTEAALHPALREQILAEAEPL